MSVKTEITVIIPCYNAGRFLMRSVDSVLNQTFHSFELIIVNDGSTDKTTLQILKKYSSNEKVKIIFQKNKGLSNARNTGIKNSQSPFVLMLDADDWISLDTLKIFFNFLKKNKKYHYVYSNINLADEKKGILKKNYNYFEQLFTNQIPYCALFRKAALQEFGGYDEKMKKGFEDWDLNIRLGSKNKHGKCINKQLFNYNVSKSGMLLNQTLRNYAEIFEYIRQKNNKLYKFSYISKCFFKWKNTKSNYNLILFFFYWIFLKILSNKIINYFFQKFYRYSTSNILQERENIKFKSFNRANKILHVITSLDVGGAEKALYLLINNTKKTTNHEVICLKGKGYFYKKLRKIGIKVYTLNMVPKRFNLLKQLKFLRLIKQIDFNILQTWLYHSDLISSFYSFFVKKNKRENIIWTVHNNNLELFNIGFLTKLVVFLCAILSHISPSKIVSVSKSSIKTHTNFGYSKKKFLHIPPIFSQAKEKKKIYNSYGDKILKNLKRKKNLVYFGHLARWDKQKNHLFLIDTFSHLKRKNFKIIMAGKNINQKNKILNEKIKNDKLKNNILLLDNIENTDLFFKKIDVNVLPSLGESFPISLCEAMLNKVPSIVSDVGDNKNIVGNSGWVFESKNGKDFITKVNSSLNEIKSKKIWNIRKNSCFNRMTNNFSNDLLIKKYYSIWRSDPYEI